MSATLHMNWSVMVDVTTTAFGKIRWAGRVTHTKGTCIEERTKIMPKMICPVANTGMDKRSFMDPPLAPVAVRATVEATLTKSKAGWKTL